MKRVVDISQENDNATDGWLVMLPGETVCLTVDMSSIKRVIKHFDRDMGRFYLCFEQTCMFCMEGIPKRLRYQARVMFDSVWWQWEFGKEVYRLLKQLAIQDHSVKVIVIRQGSGPRTRYWINKAGGASQNHDRDKYIRGRYGHMVRR